MESGSTDESQPAVARSTTNDLETGRTPASASEPRSGVVAAWLLAGYAAHVLLRTVLAAGRYGPVNFADETGYLVNARFLTGGPAGQMAQSMFYRGGYALLTSPAYLLSDDPHTSYRIVLFLNALMTSAVFPLLYLLLTRAFGVRARPALAAGVVAALYPPLVLSSLLAMSEAALYGLVLLSCAVLALLVAARRRAAAWAWAVLLGVLAGYLYTTHGRTAPVVVLLLCALAVLGLLRRDLRVPAAAGLAAGAAALYAGQALNTYLLDHNWGPDRAGADVDLILDKLRSEGVAGGVAVLGLGQYWYFAVGTFGLFALGAVQAARTLRLPAHPPDPPGPPGRRLRAAACARVAPQTGGGPVVAALLVLSLLGLVLLTGVFLYAPNRPDIVIYGRYSEVVLPAFLALGVYRLWHGRPAWRVVAEAVAGGGLAVLAYAGFAHYRDDLVFGPVSNSYTTLSVPALADSVTRIHPDRVLAVALLCGLVLVLLRWGRWRYLAAAGLVAALVHSSAYTRRHLFDHTQDRIYGADRGAVVRVPGGIWPPQDVGYDVGYLTVEGRWGFQWQLGETHFVLFDSTAGDPPPPVRYVISSVDWPQARRHGARLVWAATHGRQAVWLIGSAPPAPLTTAEDARGRRS